MRHPSGDRTRGLVDLIYPTTSIQENFASWRRRFRSNSSRNSFSLGNASEIIDRISGYADNKLEHVILGDVTGVVGGLDEINASAGQLQPLVAALRELTSVGSGR